MRITISMNDVVKTFDAAPALDEFTVQLGIGAMHSFHGPNEAGKSTTDRDPLGRLQCARQE